MTTLLKAFRQARSDNDNRWARGHGRAGRRLSPRQEISRITQVWRLKCLRQASKSLFGEDASTSSPLATKETGTVGHGPLATNWHCWSRHPVSSFYACLSFAVAGLRTPLLCCGTSLCGFVVLSSQEKANFSPFCKVKISKSFERWMGVACFGNKQLLAGGGATSPLESE